MRYIFTLLLFIGIGIAKAQNVRAFVEISDETPEVNQKVRIKFILEGNSFSGYNYKPYSFPGGLSILTTGTNEGYSFLNGKRSITIKKEYYVVCNKEGKITIPPFTFIVNGKELKTKRKTINVGKASKQTSKQYNGRVTDLMLKTYVSKRNVTLGEKITVTYKVFVRQGRFMDVSSQEVIFPEYEGVWNESIDIGKNNQSREVIKNIPFSVYTLKKDVIYPQKSGRITIDPAEIHLIVNMMYHKKLKSAPITLNVLPLPKPPKYYNGAVGKYDFEVSINRTELKENEAFKLTVKITGEGNLKVIDELPIKFPTEFETYDPEIKQNIKVSSSGMKGSKSFDYVIVPRNPGMYEIGPFQWDYYDPRKKQFIHLSQESITIKVGKGTEGQSPSMYTPKSKESVEINKDLHYIISKSGKSKDKNRSHLKSTLYITGIGLPFFSLLFIFFLVTKKGKDEGNENYRSKIASKKAKKALVVARNHLKTGDSAKFSEAMFTGLYDYLKDKFKINSSALNKEIIQKELSAKSISDTTLNELISVISEIEMTRFSPLQEADQKAILERGEKVINQIESEFKL